MKKHKALSLIIISAVALMMMAPTLVSCAGTSSSGTIEQILSIIPDTYNNRVWVAINDYAQMRKEFQINAPRTNATAEEQLQYLTDLFTLDGLDKILTCAAPAGFVNNNYAYLIIGSLPAMDNLGLGYWSIDQEAAAGQPPTNVSLLKGQFDPEKTRQALAVSAKDDPPSTEVYGNNTIFSWGGENEVNLTRRFAPPAYDVLGRGGRFVFQNDYAFRTNTTPEIKLIVDTRNSKHSSLAQVSEFKLIANELSSRGAMSVLLSNRTQSVDFVKSVLTSSQYKPEDINAHLVNGPRLLPYQTIGLGIARDEKDFMRS